MKEALGDNELISWIQSGNRREEDRALTYIYQQYYPDLSHWLTAKGLPSMVEASDVFQYGLMAFYRMVQAPDFELTKSASIKTLLYAICKNRRKNEWRSHFRHEKAVQQVELKETADDDIVHEVVIKERDQFVADLINQLEERCKRLLGFFYYEKKKHLEIAEIMRFKSAQQSRNALLKCRQKLNKKIVENPYWKEWIHL